MFSDLSVNYYYLSKNLAYTTFLHLIIADFTIYTFVKHFSQNFAINKFNFVSSNKRNVNFKKWNV